METKKTSNKFSPEVRARAVRMVHEHQADYPSQWMAIQSVATKIVCSGETLRNWVRQDERDRGERPGLTTDERTRLKELERENRELRQAKTSFARRRLILRRRSSTAGRSHDLFY